MNAPRSFVLRCPHCHKSGPCGLLAVNPNQGPTPWYVHHACGAWFMPKCSASRCDKPGTPMQRGAFRSVACPEHAQVEAEAYL